MIGHDDALATLNPTTDNDASTLASAQAHNRLIEAIVADQPAPQRRRFALGFGRPILAGGGAMALAVAVVVLLVSGGSTRGPQIAQAQTLARIEKAVANMPGTIVIQNRTYRIYKNGTTAFNRVKPTTTGRLTQIVQTSTKDEAVAYFQVDSALAPGVQFEYTTKFASFYDPLTHTIYRNQSVHSVPTGGELGGDFSSWASGGDLAPGHESVFEQELKRHVYRIDGTVTIRGQKALKLVPVHKTIPTPAGPYTYPTIYMSARTFYPVREVIQEPGEEDDGDVDVWDWFSYKVLPATAANERRLSLTARHPGVPIDDNTRDFARAYKVIDPGGEG